MMETQVVVIGGGITGVGVLRDLAMRGIAAVLIEKGDLANGTSARFHGLLHSGARYAVTDPVAAKECLEENRILKKIAGHCLENTGGIFAKLAADDPGFVTKWVAACRQSGIDVQELDVSQLLHKEPNLSSNITAAFCVPDAAVDGFLLVRENALAAQKYGAKVCTYTEAVKIETANGKVRGVRVKRLSGEEVLINCRLVVNAAGPWTSKVAQLAGVKLETMADKGTLLVFNHRLTNTIVNHCRAPGDGDILVPHHTVSIYGTTSANVEGPEADWPTHQEVSNLLAIGRELIPALDDARIIRAFAGVRPLYREQPEEKQEQGRGVTRNFFVIDHNCKDGLDGLISIVGGKFTTYRLMAEKAVDLVAQKLGNSVPCRTALETLRGSKEVMERGTPGREEQILCECEQVSDRQLWQAIAADEQINLNGLRRKTRLGMGTCQGTFCAYRALGMLHRAKQLSPSAGKHVLLDLLGERWKGMRPVLWGQTLQEAELMRAIYSNMLNTEGLEDTDGQQI